MGRYELFKEYNTRKLNALQDTLTSQKWRVFVTIQALIHHNLPGLPGVRDGSEPHGFARSFFAVDHAHYAGEFFPDFRGRVPPPGQSRFLGLYAMGSVGSVCFTSASDIDFWLIHAANAFSAAEKACVREKLAAIERWAEETAGLEIHFYLHDLAEIQKATFSYDAENAGEFGALLKDEFLRTAVWVAGLEPAHWEGESSRSIDFGPIPHLTAEQYLAACIMQIEKALEKPFKSVLKIALLRRLASLPGEKLPTELVIERIAHGETPDPYMILLEQLRDYFQRIGNEEDLPFLKSALYLKMVAEETSPERLRRNRDRILVARFQAIGNAIDFDRLEKFFEWPFEERIRFSDQIARFLQISLRDLSRHEQAKAIDPAKIRGLTRRIMLRRAGGHAIEHLTFADVPSRGEPWLSFIFHPEREDWVLSLQRFSGRPDYANLQVIRRASSAVSLLAFTIINNLYRRDRTEIRSFPTDIFPRRATEILEAMERLLARRSAPGAIELPVSADFHLGVLEQPAMKDAESRCATLLTRTSWGMIEARTWRGAEALAEMFKAVLAAPALGGAEFICDYLGGPNADEIAAAMRLTWSGDDDACILKDGTSYLLLYRGQVIPAVGMSELLMALGKGRGPYDFKCLPSGEDGVFLVELQRRIPARGVVLLRLARPKETVFLLMDRDGRCDAWVALTDDARFNLAATCRFLEKSGLVERLECLTIDHWRDQRDSWRIAPFSLELDMSSPSTDLHFTLREGGLAEIGFGATRIDAKPLDEACALVARLIRAARRNNRYYPPFLTGLTFPDSVRHRIGITEALRMKREIEARIGSLLARLY